MQIVSLNKTILIAGCLLLAANASACRNSGEKPTIAEKKAFTDDLKRRTFEFFWDRIDQSTYQTDDRYPTAHPSSIAATGFGLASYTIGIHNGFITREAGSDRVLKTMKQKYGDRLYQQYGFKDSFNPTYTFDPKHPGGWFDVDYLGIDQGPILIQLENYETGLIWNTLKKNPYIVNGLRKAGFTGGWLDEIKPINP
jgi:hypothetical protein